MNKDQVKGKMDEVVGTVKRKTGEWTGNEPLEIKGVAQELQGKIETATGNAQSAIDETKAKVVTHAKSALEDTKAAVKHLTHN
ncbi:MAG: CsbD family protein [Terracidiphilus sp.]|nr:CsbD family protein [Terracidiphilus sp.]